MGIAKWINGTSATTPVPLSSRPERRQGKYLISAKTMTARIYIQYTDTRRIPIRSYWSSWPSLPGCKQSHRIERIIRFVWADRRLVIAECQLIVLLPIMTNLQSGKCKVGRTSDEIQKKKFSSLAPDIVVKLPF